MTDNDNSAKAGRARKWGWGKWITLLFGLLVIGVVGLYLVVSSSWFVKQMVVPRLSRSFNSSVTVSSVSFKPFSGIQLSGFRLNPNDKEWLINADEVSLRYDFGAFLKSRIRISEISLKRPEINLIHEEDGSSNLDPILESLGDAESKEISEPMDLLIQKATIEDGIFRWRRALAESEQQEIQLTDVGATLTDFGSDTAGQIEATGDVEIARSGKTATDGERTSTASLAGRINANYKFHIDKALVPSEINGNARFRVTRGENDWEDLAGIEANVDTEFASNTIERFVSHFQQNGTTLGEIRVRGPLKPEASEADLEFDVASLDQKALDLFGATLGIEFVLAQLDGKGNLRLANGGNQIESAGTFDAPGFQLRHPSLKTPSLDIQVGYDFTFDLEAFELLLRDARMDATRNGRSLISMALENPVKASWSESKPTVGDSTVSVSVNELRLADWQTAYSDMAPSGTVSLSATSTVTDNGDHVALDLNGSGSELTLQMTTNRVENLLFATDLKASIDNFESIQVARFSSKVTHAGNLVLTGDGAGQFNLDKEAGEATLTFKAAPKELLSIYPVPDLAVAEGETQGELKLTVTADQTAAQGRLSLASFRGAYADYPINRLFSDLSYDIARQGENIKLNEVRLETGPSADTTATIQLSGHYHQKDETGELAFTARRLTEKTLSPWLSSTNGSPALPYGFAVDAEGSTTIQSDGKQTFKSKVDLSEVRSLAGSSGSRQPLGAQINLDGSWKDSRLVLDPVDLSWPATQQAENKLTLNTDLDLNATNATANVVRVRGNSVDLTRWYDELYAQAPAGEEEPREAPPEGEEGSGFPGPPWQLDAEISEVYLRELVATNLQAKATVEPSMLKIEPLKLALNGGSVGGRVQYEPTRPNPAYDVALKVDEVPMAPLARSFSPSFKWAYHGKISMDGAIAGRGFDGESLKKSLTGHFRTGLSDGQIEIQNTWAKALMVPISTVLRLPQLLRTPIHTIDVSTTFKDAKIQIEEAAVRATEFRAQTEGEIPISSSLTQSAINLPIQIELKRSLAERAHLLPPDTPEDAEYVALPKFARITGTLGNFKTAADEKMIAGFIVKSVGGLSGSVGEEASEVLKKFGDILPPEVKGSLPSTKKDATESQKEKPQEKEPEKAIKDLFRGFLDRAKEKEQDQEQAEEKEGEQKDEEQKQDE